MFFIFFCGCERLLVGIDKRAKDTKEQVLFYNYFTNACKALPRKAKNTLPVKACVCDFASDLLV
jgi:hypothetical protein